MIYIVSGFFRSGTSMMMQALDAGGLPVYRSCARDELNERYTDAAGRPNPVSLYEPSALDLREVGFPRQHDGMAVKILIPWLASMAVHEYRVVVMTRSPEQIVASYERAFHEYWDGATRGRWVEQYQSRIDSAIEWFGNRRDVCSVDVIAFESLLADPGAVFAKLAWPIDSVRASQIVSRSCPAS